jgi:hypothetical protein
MTQCHPQLYRQPVEQGVLKVLWVNISPATTTSFVPRCPSWFPEVAFAYNYFREQVDQTNASSDNSWMLCPDLRGEPDVVRILVVFFAKMI